MSPAQKIIKKCGGVQAVADIIGVRPVAVYKWTYPKDRGGTDGRVPTHQQQALLDGARERGINLTADDFFESEAA